MEDEFLPMIGVLFREISVIVNLRKKPDRPPFDFLRRIMIWVPITIWVTPSLELVDNLIKQLNQLFDQGYRILIHDTLGIHRLGFIITAFYMQKYRLNREEALYLVKQKKPDIKPTENYLQLLTQYEKYLNL
ncbi:dual specificity protein phosphatase family protein [Peribacillus butanolivorans]|uniref:dual specificity protein phosphatase family protein n=1 Tax=Peribacillus butanolivorans TaxID=421767 RepID=UPI002E24C102|nr:dual specificity protein phosphatase family protein [Peribacillus butanolivorans]MED3690756.1 dual specificity protein phosphatase family protein [Peribacillus butanolivorans]